MNAARQNPVTAFLVLVVLVVLVLAPVLFSQYFVSAILTEAVWFGIAAASLIFLSGYAGMVSLAQTAMYGIAAFAMGNVVAADGGVAAAWNPWLGVLFGIAVAVVIGLVFGLIASRSTGIYFLMITLAFGVIVFYFWGAVTQLSGFGGLNNVAAPSYLGNPVKEPNPLYYTALGVAAAVYLLLRYVIRTPFGMALQGIRDDAQRMRALGYNIYLHRTFAFGFAAFIAALAGILSVWWNTRIDPNSIAVDKIIDLLVIAVVGGLFRLEGAWIGAIVFVVLDNYTRGTSLIGERFNTLIGLVFLIIVLVSPGGLAGIWAQASSRLQRVRREGDAPPPAAGEVTGTS